MKKLTLKFQSIADVANCAKSLQSGYIINTVALTLTAIFTNDKLQQVKNNFNVTSIETFEPTFSH